MTPSEADHWKYTCIAFVPCEGAHEEEYETFVESKSKRMINRHLHCDPDEKPKRRATPNILIDSPGLGRAFKCMQLLVQPLVRKLELLKFVLPA